MAITTSWAVKIGYYDNGTTWSLTDLTDRVTGLTVDQFTDLAVVGTSTAAVTFENSDGELTPGAGGTYSSTDWFRRALVIQATVTSNSGSETVQVFGGIIDDFDLQDDGISSTVTMGAIDVIQTAGRQPVDFGYGSVTYSSGHTITRVLLEPASVENNTVLPNWGETAEPDGVLTVTDVSGGNGRPVRLEADVAEQGPVGDYMANQVVTAGLTAIWPGALDVSDGHAELFTLENAIRTSPKSFSFAESPGAGEFPFRDLHREFNIDQLTNVVQITRVGQTDTQTAPFTSATIPIYGPRVRIYESGATTDDNAIGDAQDWQQRFEYARFVAEKIRVTAGMIEQDGTDADYDDWADLLDPEFGIWAGAKIEYTPAGSASSLTEYSLIIGRTIKASPNDTTITMTLRPLKDYGVFILDDPTFGVISQNRLG